MIESVRLVLQPGLIEIAARQRLWDKGAAQGSYRIGFLQAEPDSLPDGQPARADFAAIEPVLADLAAAGNSLALLLRRSLSAPGQAFLATAEQALRKLSDQDAVVALLNALSEYFAAARTGLPACQEMALILTEAEATARQSSVAQAVRASLPGQEAELVALHALARMDESIVTPVFARSSASGSLMRRKIEPILRPVFEQIAVLRRAPHG